MGLTQVSGSARVFNYEARSALALPFLFNSRWIRLFRSNSDCSTFLSQIIRPNKTLRLRAFPVDQLDFVDILLALLLELALKLVCSIAC